MSSSVRFHRWVMSCAVCLSLSDFTQYDRETCSFPSTSLHMALFHSFHGLRIFWLREVRSSTLAFPKTTNGALPVLFSTSASLWAPRRVKVRRSSHSALGACSHVHRGPGPAELPTSHVQHGAPLSPSFPESGAAASPSLCPAPLHLPGGPEDAL